MLTLLTSILATALLAQPPDSIVLSGVVVDAAEKPLSDVDVVLWARIPRRWNGPHAGTDDDRLARRIPPRDRPATVAGTGAASVYLCLPTGPVSRRSRGRSDG